jgi:octaprenyl-diphosphate synthase
MFGYNLGMASQIANDIQGITRGRDILKRKITLPVIYALSQADGEARHQLELTFSKQSESAPSPAQTRDLLFNTGAIHYATIKMELYKQQALDILSKAEGAGANVERLRLFLE